jgi:uncharacterized protein YbbC (DUF1343 family)
VPVRLPVDHLEELWPSDLCGARVGALLHAASVSSQLVNTLDILEGFSGKLFKLAALFGPQHGFYGQTQDNMIEWRGFIHPRLGVPVFSLYGEHREPTPDMLGKIDALFVDLQDVGARYYTFIWTLYLCMRACEKAGVTVVVADRPNPINGVKVEGPIPGEKYRSFVGMHPIPVRHGKTIGELAMQFRAEAFPQCRLHVLPMKNWQREMWWDETGLKWVMPSPNMPSLDTAIVYPGMCLLEGTNISEGRGTTRPFEIFGAPWVDARDLCVKLNALDLPGVFFREIFFQPAFHKFANELCSGAQLHVLDREMCEPFRTGVAIINEIRRSYPEQFQWKQPPYEYEYEKLPIEILIGAPVENFFPSF